MFKVNEDKSIYVTRGDYCEIPVAAVINGEVSKFKSGDVLRFKATKKKDCNTVVIQRDYLVETETDAITFHLTGDDTRIGAVISKPTDYWYEVELNPDTDPQTIIGYDEDGAKVLRLFPEGADVNAEDIEVVGKQTLQDLVDTALAQAKASGAFDGEDGKPGADGYTPQKNVDYFDGKDGKDGLPGQDGSDGITPHIGDNGNWFVGDTDTGKPSRGIQGEHGKDGSIDVTATVGQTIVVEEVDENGKPTKWKAMDYQPRTHYENGTEIKTLFDQTITVANNAWRGSGIVNLVDGNTYTVVWDGTTYECVAFATIFNDANAIALGNPYFLGVGENNNQPFVFGWAYEYGMLASGSMTNGDHTIKITGEVKVYKKLDECYLPIGLMPYILKVYYISLEDGVPQNITANVGARFDIVAETLWNGGRVVLDFTGTELTNEYIYKAEVVEWWLRPQTNGTNDIVLWYLYKGKPTSYSIIGGTWTPPTT